MAKSGITVGSYVFLDQGYSVSWSVDDNEAHFEIGRDPSELQLSATECGLTKLIQELTEARDELREIRKSSR